MENVLEWIRLITKMFLVVSSFALSLSWVNYYFFTPFYQNHYLGLWTIVPVIFFDFVTIDYLKNIK